MKATFVCKVLLGVSLLFLPSTASSQETYVFDRMWPALNLSWNFLIPNGIAFDKSGNLYVADSKTHRIVKLTQDGFYITSWGSRCDLMSGEDCVDPDCSGPLEPGDGQFNIPLGVAVDDEGNVYVSEQGNHRIQKFDSEGHLLKTWGSYCEIKTGDGCEGQFNVPGGLAVDSWGNVYVADVDNNRVQKFKSNGDYLLTFEGDLSEPHDVAIDSRNIVYVADSGNSRILRYTLDGNYVDELPPECRGFSFKYPSDLAIDDEDNIYIAEQDSDNIQKVGSDGKCIIKWWGGIDNIVGTFYKLNSIAIDKSGYVYATDADSIQKFTDSGNRIIKWSNSGSDNGKFNSPEGVSLDTEGFVYVADSENYRIQKFTPDGQYEPWENQEIVNEQFGYIGGIATDADNNVIVVDYGNKCIKKFTSGGEFRCQWGGEQFISPYAIAVDGSGNVFVTDVDFHHIGIQKFKPTPDGNHCTDGSGYEPDGWWGSHYDDTSRPPGPDEFISLWGIAVDDRGNVYVTDDNLKPRILKYGPTVDGTGGLNGSGYILDTEWGLDHDVIPWAIAVDTENGVYVTDTVNDRIQKFSSTMDGTGGIDNSGYDLDTEWGSTGSWAAQLEKPRGIAVSENGSKVYVSDYGNNRVQVFRKFDVPSRPKAIIVAGGGPYPGNSLWDATQTTANFAYLTLLNRGFTKEDIYYLTSDIDVDMDGNDEFIEIDGLCFSDDVFAIPTNKSLKQAITDAADDNAESLVIYLTDHGNDLDGGTFYLNEHYEPLKSRDLASWLETVEEGGIPGEITVIYDGCQSGSFIDDLSGVDRIIVTSAQQYEQAKFLNQGTISFSSFFWTNIFNRFSIGEAYDSATKAINFYFSNQNPQLTGSADDVYIDFLPGDNEAPVTDDAPTIEYVSSILEVIEGPVNNDASVDLYAYNVFDPDGISRVWAEIRPPDRNLGLVNEPLLGQLDTIELIKLPEEECPEEECPEEECPEENCYRGTFSRFEENGLYQIAIYAMDGKGNTSSPPTLTTVSLNDTIVRKAIIIAGDDEELGATESMIETNVRLAYNALISQGYNDDMSDDICFLGTNLPWVDGEPTIENLQNCIHEFSQIDAGEGFIDLVIYLTGEGGTETFTLKDSGEMLNASVLAELLNNFQKDRNCRVTLIYDANYSGSFIPVLTPPRGMERILITSSGENEEAYFNEAGNISFSHFFWGQASIGATLYRAFAYANNAIAYFNRRKEISFSCYKERGPRLEANGESPPNEAADYGIAQELTIGKGEVFADDNAPPPTIGSVWAEEIKEGEVVTDIVIGAKDIICYSDSCAIEKVWAVIKPVKYCPESPGEEKATYQDQEFELGPDGNGQYKSDPLTYDQLPKTYKILVYASAKDENDTISVSSPRESKFYHVQLEGGDGDGDIYEDDNDPSEANVIVVNHPTPQPHTFHRPYDEDWVKFYAITTFINPQTNERVPYTYRIKAGNLGENCEPLIVLYHEDDLEKPIESTVVIVKQEEDEVVLTLELDECEDEGDEQCGNGDGIYYVQLLYTENCAHTEYELQVNNEDASLTEISGRVLDLAGDGIDNAKINILGGGYDTSKNGSYGDIYLFPATWKLTATHNQYKSVTKTFTVNPGEGFKSIDVKMQPRTPRVECSEDARCDDGDYCNGVETCVDGSCQAGDAPCPDDGLYCNGKEVCDELTDMCSNTGDPCPIDLRCDEDGNACVGCLTDTDCPDDGEFCNGVKICVDGTCQDGDPCPEGMECDEENDACMLPTITVVPDTLLQFPWFPRLVILRINGTHTHFKELSNTRETTVTFSQSSIMVLAELVWTEETMWCIGLLMPLWITEELGESIEVQVSTGPGVASDTIAIELLSFIPAP